MRLTVVRVLGLLAIAHGLLIFVAVMTGLLACARSAAPALSPLEQLGKSVFFDRRLSLRGNQSCASCHAPQVGWTGDLPLVNAGPAVYEGSVSGLFGNRKPPTVAYAMAPVLHTMTEDGETLFVGGNFWDGRATGERLGDPIAEQAQGPFVNPVEQALPDTGCVVRRVCAADYPSRSRHGSLAVAASRGRRTWTPRAPCLRARCRWSRRIGRRPIGPTITSPRPLLRTNARAR